MLGSCASLGAPVWEEGFDSVVMMDAASASRIQICMVRRVVKLAERRTCGPGGARSALVRHRRRGDLYSTTSQIAWGLSF
jgi:hypothetical protein